MCNADTDEEEEGIRDQAEVLLERQRTAGMRDAWLDRMVSHYAGTVQAFLACCSTCVSMARLPGGHLLKVGSGAGQGECHVMLRRRGH